MINYYIMYCSVFLTFKKALVAQSCSLSTYINFTFTKLLLMFLLNFF